jgi:hypothetical protein
MLRPLAHPPKGGSSKHVSNGGLPLFSHSSSQRRQSLRCAVAATCGCLLLAFLYVSLWWSALVFPATVAQAARWSPRTAEAQLALQDAPAEATSVGLVVARFSGNLSWVPAVQQLMQVTETTVYCKARGVWGQKSGCG